MKTITLTDDQIADGRNAAMARTSQWKPTPPEGVALAKRLYQERGRFRARAECAEVAALIGWSETGTWERFLCGELGLPTSNVERALAFASGQRTYTRADGSVRRVGDDRDYEADREKWVPYEWWAGARASFDGLTHEFVNTLWQDACPCCGVSFRSGDAGTSPSLDHLIPGIRSRDNARLICAACNRIKQDALPATLHLVADWMEKSPAEMLALARTLSEMPKKQVRPRDRRKEMLSGKKWQAKQHGIEFSLTIDDLPFTAICPVLDVPFLLPGSEEMAAALKEAGVRNRSFWNSPSFDRIDPRLGYVAGNVVLVSNLANAIMSNATSPDRVRIVAEWFDRELAAAPALAALIDHGARDSWAMAAE